MKVIPLTDEQSAEFARLIGDLRLARQQHDESRKRELQAELNLSTAVTALAQAGELSEDGKYLVVYA